MRRTKGFTLIELVMVLVILAILVGLALPTFLGARQKAYRAEALQILGEMKTLAWGFNLENGGTSDTPTLAGTPVWPTTMADLGYQTGSPDTDNWAFVAPTNATAGTYGVAGGTQILCSATNCTEMRANADATSPAAGLDDVVLYINPNGISVVVNENQP